MIYAKKLSISLVFSLVCIMAVEYLNAQTMTVINDGFESIDNVVVSGLSEPGWYPYTIARSEDRELIRSSPMVLRPYRPLHFYGNTIRRNYYRGVAIPMPRDVYKTIVMPLRRGTANFSE